MGLSVVLKGIMLIEQGCNLKSILQFLGHPYFKLNLQAQFHDLQAINTPQIQLLDNFLHIISLKEYCRQIQI